MQAGDGVPYHPLCFRSSREYRGRRVDSSSVEERRDQGDLPLICSRRSGDMMLCAAEKSS